MSSSSWYIAMEMLQQSSTLHSLKRYFQRKTRRSVSPVKDAIDYGMKYTFHQDTPVVPPDMMRTVSSAVNRV